MSDKYSVTLAPVRKEDFAVIEKWTCSNAWIHFSGCQGFLSAARVKAFLTHIEQGDEVFLMVYAPDGQAVGMVSWAPTATPGNYAVGTMIGDADMWGAGFGAAATIRVLGLLFDSLKAHRVELRVGTYNRRVVADVCLSGLFTVEGILRDYFFLDGEYYDSVCYSVLSDEYYSMRAPMEVIPAEDKAEARRILAEFLEKNPIMPRSLAGY
jgi:diamine N-acetyltransferase